MDLVNVPRGELLEGGSCRRSSFPDDRSMRRPLFDSSDLFLVIIEGDGKTHTLEKAACR